MGLFAAVYGKENTRSRVIGLTSVHKLYPEYRDGQKIADVVSGRVFRSKWQFGTPTNEGAGSRTLNAAKLTSGVVIRRNSTLAILA